uniref:Uncharacterized protein n=1 Tax=Meloidogyne enterolobii TaxID=390850 RepID=A0A6V7XFY1_MELEN|nr:unnamed protein product [Meloidogyne enterolobii]
MAGALTKNLNFCLGDVIMLCNPVVLQLAFLYIKFENFRSS